MTIRTAIQAEADFINRFSADETDTETTTTPDASETEDQTEESSAADASGDDDEGRVDDDDSGEVEEGGEGDKGEQEEDGGKDGGEEQSESDEDSEEPEDPDEETPEAKAAAKATAEHSEAIRDMLKGAGLKLSLKDIPAEARPLVQKKLDHAQAAITRVLQEQTAFRKERSTMLAEQAFRQEHPEQAIAELLANKPELIEKVQAEIDKFDDPDKKRLFEITVKENRDKALKAVTDADQADERILQRADEIETYTRRATASLGIPYELVEQAIGLEMRNRIDEGKSPDLTEDELDLVITRQARLLKGNQRRVALVDKKKLIQERTKDKKTSTPAVRGGKGSLSPAPAGKPKPKNDAEFINDFSSRI